MKLQLSRTLLLPVPSQRYRATDGKSVLLAYLINTDFPSKKASVLAAPYPHISPPDGESTRYVLRNAG